MWKIKDLILKADNNLKGIVCTHLGITFHSYAGMGAGRSKKSVIVKQGKGFLANSLLSWTDIVFNIEFTLGTTSALTSTSWEMTNLKGSNRTVTSMALYSFANVGSTIA